jgi:hypothetical protein
MPKANPSKLAPKDSSLCSLVVSRERGEGVDVYPTKEDNEPLHRVIVGSISDKCRLLSQYYCIRDGGVDPPTPLGYGRAGGTILDLLSVGQLFRSLCHKDI